MIISPDAINQDINDGQYIFDWDLLFQTHQTALERFYTELFNNATSLYLSRPTIKDIYLMCGLPGSGKSTWARENDKPDALIYDATNLDRWRRLSFASAARSFHIPIHCAYMDINTLTCCKRQKDRGNGKAVPISTIQSMAKRIEAPSEMEGFTSIITISE